MLQSPCPWKRKPFGSMPGGISTCFYRMSVYSCGSDQDRCASEKSPVCGFLFASECDCQSGLFRSPLAPKDPLFPSIAV